MTKSLKFGINKKVNLEQDFDKESFMLDPSTEKTEFESRPAFLLIIVTLVVCFVSLMFFLSNNIR